MNTGSGGKIWEVRSEQEIERTRKRLRSASSQTTADQGPAPATPLPSLAQPGCSRCEYDDAPPTAAATTTSFVDQENRGKTNQSTSSKQKRGKDLCNTNGQLRKKQRQVEEKGGTKNMGQETAIALNDNDDDGQTDMQVRHLHPDATRTLDVLGLTGCRYSCSELVRVMEQALYTLGYPDVARHLEKASGVDLHSQRVQNLQQGCLSGKWKEVIDLMDQQKEDLFGISNRSSNMPLSTTFLVEERVQKAKFLVLEQKYLECLSLGDVQKALHCLREEITPLGINMQRLHELASLMRCRTWQDLVQCKAWGDNSHSMVAAGGPNHTIGGSRDNNSVSANADLSTTATTVSNNSSGGGNSQQSLSRQQLLTKLQEVIPSSVMLPENRLESLIGQAVAHQVSRCMYYNKTDTTFSLLSDYACGPEQIPSVTSQVLDGHSDEVWHVQFSNGGGMLASASADGTCIIWERTEIMSNGGGNGHQHYGHHASSSTSNGVERKFAIKSELLGHKKPIAFVSWSPNDKYLLTCGNDNVLNVWDVDTGKVHHRYEKHTDSVTSCAWLPDSERFVSGSIDKYIYMWHLDGRCIKNWKGSRINDLAISRSGKWMVSISNEKKFQLYDLVKDAELAVQEQESIISLCLSKHSDLLLVNLQNQKIHLWDLNDFFASQGTAPLPTEPIRRYRGQHEKQGRYVIRSCFGGSNETFVVSGSEDSQVYIWHQQKGELLKVLSGHSGTVNAVTWNPTDPYTFASASDDHSIRIWGTSTTSVNSAGQ
jgi:WD40 repeat protein